MITPKLRVNMTTSDFNKTYNKRVKIVSFESFGLSLHEKFNIDFLDSDHLGFSIRKILAILIYKSPRYFH